MDFVISNLRLFIRVSGFVGERGKRIFCHGCRYITHDEQQIRLTL